MKKALASLIAITVGFLSAPAFATCVSGCVTPPPPAPTATEFNVLGWSSTQVMSGAVFTGQKGGSYANQEGFSGARVLVNAEGTGCGFNCGNVHSQIEAFAQQTAQSGSWGQSAGSNQPVTAVGVTQAGVNAGFGIFKK